MGCDQRVGVVLGLPDAGWQRGSVLAPPVPSMRCDPGLSDVGRRRDHRTRPLRLRRGAAAGRPVRPDPRRHGGIFVAGSTASTTPSRSVSAWPSRASANSSRGAVPDDQAATPQAAQMVRPALPRNLQQLSEFPRDSRKPPGGPAGSVPGSGRTGCARNGPAPRPANSARSPTSRHSWRSGWCWICGCSMAMKAGIRSGNCAAGRIQLSRCMSISRGGKPSSCRELVDPLSVMLPPSLAAIRSKDRIWTGTRAPGAELGPARGRPDSPH